ncbi:MAG: hypothetical protein PHN74_03650 [Candidatus Pacebacteria bacterium]|nr:hypothetical protein [Candidatus Paceibacterota bacterium]
MKNSKLVYYGIIHSVGVFLYVSAVAFLMFNGEKLFGGKADNFLQPVAMLLLLVVSAAITGSLVLVRPINFYLSGMKREAVKLLIYTIISLVLITLIVFAANIIW